MKIFLTGFEPFADYDTNPSQWVVEKLGVNEFPGVDLKTAILPVTYHGADEVLRHWLEQIRPDVFIALGLAGRAQHITLERVALNLDDAEIPDNAGELRQGDLIEPGGPAAYFSTLPLENLKIALQASGYPVRISNHAGAYLCNHVFYRARSWSGQAPEIPCGFIHLPPLGAPWPENSPVTWSFEHLVGAITQVIQVVAR